MIEVFEGDTVRIRLDNQLSQETTVHWHGLPVPPAQDGNPMDPIAPGASRTYEFTLPVGSAGTYWYHPHPHELTAEQVFRGMAGLLIVRSRSARYLRLALAGHTLTLVGTDGGLLQAPVPGVDEILLAPAGRVEVIVTAGLAAGARATLQSLPYERGSMGMMGGSSSRPFLC